MKRSIWIGSLLAGLVAVSSSGAQRGHHLPAGPERLVRERAIDIVRVSGDFRVDLTERSLAGDVTIRLAPLRAMIESIELDAAGLEIATVEVLGPDGSPAPVPFVVAGRHVQMSLPTAVRRGEPLDLRLTYTCHPASGLYFFPRSAKGGLQAWNYGEGGLHYGWLPLYNDTNDRFAVDFHVTVSRPYVALGNGTLAEVRDNADGTRTFRWVQEEPIPNYLLALNVGEFVEVKLDDARVGERSIPLSVWVEPGKEQEAAHAFADTPRMVEYFAERFGYPYVWPKYDQVLLRDFDGAMETTSMVGFGEYYLRNPGDPRDAEPDLTVAYSSWSAQDTIAHELAHHWFGDLLTCRSLGSIWLNESFASFAHTLWNGHTRGEDDLTHQRWRYRQAYLDYVRETGEVRPLEFMRYAAPEDMYQSETTYIKGALVLHMLRHFVGEEEFWRGVKGYLERHAFGEVEAIDFQRAVEEATGRNLGWFFDDWIVGGGGHPVFEVAYRWSPDRKAIDLTVDQVQGDLPFEDLFRVPVEVGIETESGSSIHVIQLENWTTRVSLPSDSRPLAVTFDPGNWLVAEVMFQQSLEEVLVQLEKGSLGSQLQAVWRLSEQHSRRPEAAVALQQIVGNPEAHWGLRQEAALGLGEVATDAAVGTLIATLRDGDREVRRAVVLGLARSGSPRAAEALRQLVLTDAAEEVAAAGSAALGRMQASGARELLLDQLDEPSRWWEVRQLGALLGLAELEDPSLVPIFRRYVGGDHQTAHRLAALDGWFRSAPDDSELPGTLRRLADDVSLSVRAAAITRLGELHRGADLGFLEDLAARELDENIARAAREAAEVLRAFNP